MTDTVETVGQDVDQEAADELVGVERHEFVARVDPAVSTGEDADETGIIVAGKDAERTVMCLLIAAR